MGNVGFSTFEILFVWIYSTTMTTIMMMLLLIISKTINDLFRICLNLFKDGGEDGDQEVQEHHVADQHVASQEGNGEIAEIWKERYICSIKKGKIWNMKWNLLHITQTTCSSSSLWSSWWSPVVWKVLTWAWWLILSNHMW